MNFSSDTYDTADENIAKISMDNSSEEYYPNYKISFDKRNSLLSIKKKKLKLPPC